MIDIKVPAVGESITEVTLVKWLKNNGEYVDRDEVIAELESEKATFEVNAEKAGALKTVGKEGDTLKIGDVVAQIDDSAAKPEKKTAEKAVADNKTPDATKKEAAPEITVRHPVVQEPAGHAPADLKATPV
ncbi:MAG TPA: biotin/lipoyl-containing protein, partial [Puia sp.]|nr:biotin/lipoyl-containing protein [Puia sp.]